MSWRSNIRKGSFYKKVRVDRDRYDDKKVLVLKDEVNDVYIRIHSTTKSYKPILALIREKEDMPIFFGNCKINITDYIKRNKWKLHQEYDAYYYTTHKRIVPRSITLKDYLEIYGNES